METPKKSGPSLPNNNQPFRSSSSYAPWYNVPHRLIVSIEHPFIIKNVDKGIASLGGSGRLQELIQDSDGGSASLYVRPGDRMSKPLQSANVNTNNVLLKVTVPKRTGLKRRRGSQGPYHEGLEAGGISASDKDRPPPASMVKDAHYLTRAMRDNSKSYQVHAVGAIGRTHRFRGMPDFVFSTANMPFMRKIRNHILPFDYEKMKGFTLDMSKGVKPNTEIIPPPSLTHYTHPFNYSYRQNPSVKQTVDQLGNVTIHNLAGRRKIFTLPVPFDVPEVPMAPATELPSIETAEPAMQRLIARGRKLMEERPIFTRRALMNCVSGDDWEAIGPYSAKYMYQYCGYSFSSGPWRDAIVRFGVDPRKDASCRVYQTMMFMLESEPKDSRMKYNRTKPSGIDTEQMMRKESHLFDGETVSKDGKVWQVCDIIDPFLKKLLATTNLRKECHIESDGWYHNGTWAKAKIIMKTKIHAILDDVPQQDAAYAKVVNEMPDVVKPNDRAQARLGKDATPYEIQLASQIRTTSLSNRAPGMERTSSQEGVYDEDERDEIAMPERSGDDPLDPRLAEAALEIDRLEGGTAQIEELVDGMDIDTAGVEEE